MKTAIISLLALVAIQASAQSSERVYQCTATSYNHFGMSGKYTSDLKSAQQSAYKACLNETSDIMSCSVASCWSKDAQGSDLHSEPTR